MNRATLENIYILDERNVFLSVIRCEKVQTVLTEILDRYENDRHDHLYNDLYSVY